MTTTGRRPEDSQTNRKPPADPRTPQEDHQDTAKCSPPNETANAPPSPSSTSAIQGFREKKLPKEFWNYGFSHSAKLRIGFCMPLFTQDARGARLARCVVVADVLLFFYSCGTRHHPFKESVYLYSPGPGTHPRIRRVSATTPFRPPGNG